MNSILFVLQGPSPDDDARMRKWLNTAKVIALDAPKTSKSVEMLNESTWLIHANDGLPFLGRAIGQAQQSELGYRVFFFEKTSELPSQTTP